MTKFETGGTGQGAGGLCETAYHVLSVHPNPPKKAPSKNKRTRQCPAISSPKQVEQVEGCPRKEIPVTMAQGKRASRRYGAKLSVDLIAQHNHSNKISLGLARLDRKAKLVINHVSVVIAIRLSWRISPDGCFMNC
jgi:hypothetical protein